MAPTAQQLFEVETYGFTVVEGVLSADEAAEIRAINLRLLDGHGEDLVFEGRAGHITNLPTPARNSHQGQARHRVGRSRAARRRPRSVAWATVKVFDAAHAPPGATRRAADIGRQAASKRLPDAQASRRTLFLACRPISAVPHLSLVRTPGLTRSTSNASTTAKCCRSSRRSWATN